VCKVSAKGSPEFQDEVSAENVRLVVSQIRAQSHLIERLEREGKLIIVGGVYHLDTR
jgi:carbonic anhydrase